jgi:hypothetical protein
MRCQNPFFKCEGKGKRITVIIRLKGQDYEVCEDCFAKIAESQIEWGEPKKEPKVITSPLGTVSFIEGDGFHHET